jgi:uncharacterized membrane protein YccC
MSNPRIAFAATFAGVLVAGLVAAVATGDWLFLLWALAADVVLTSAVLVYGAVTSGPVEPEEADLVRLEEERLAELRRRGDPRRTTRAPRGR